MSKGKIEINHPAEPSKIQPNSNNLTNINIEEAEPDDGIHLMNDHAPVVPQSITVSSMATYTEEMLLNRLNETGLLDDFIGGRKVSERSKHWVECFSRDDLVQIFTTFPKVYDRCCALLDSSLGAAALTLQHFNDPFCELFEGVLQKAKAIHLQWSWGFGEGTDEFTHLEIALSQWHQFLKADAYTAKEANLIRALDKFAESDFVHLNQNGFASISTQLHKICQNGHCSAGFTEQLSRVYAALTLARTVLFFENVLNRDAIKHQTEAPNHSKKWDYCQSAVFFKMNPELKKEIEAPLYHGNIDTEAAKCLLRNPGDYLARYSPNHKNHYITILLHTDALHNKTVLNLVIPASKRESWTTKPIEHRDEMERYLKEQLSLEHPEQTQKIIGLFLKKEEYNPIMNSVCTLEAAHAVLKI
ncbi:hypothetical protein Lmor_0320 [Legionella moravica]|uniref:SH2 domain-containing protein n=1 Tax=Legionella moravica TaxID=39962 RepID=A0A378K236_9GAMM|nr:hypothetical protein [Legionella moravica]KTD38315.1 hypothetical protein Lmor_0320 [Legionella moravica]STX63668.1 Uncharacterised protein [Legionella moravica]